MVLPLILLLLLTLGKVIITVILHEEIPGVNVSLRDISFWLSKSLLHHKKDDQELALKYALRVSSALRQSRQENVVVEQTNALIHQDLGRDFRFSFWFNLYLSKLFLHLGQYQLVLNLLSDLEVRIKIQQDESQFVVSINELNCTFLSRIIYYRGYANLYLGNYDNASSLLYTAIETCPCFYPAYLSLGQALSMAPPEIFTANPIFQLFKSRVTSIMKSTYYEIIDEIDLSSSREPKLYHELNNQIICSYETGVIGNENAFELTPLLPFTNNPSTLTTTTTPSRSIQQQYQLLLSTFHWSLFYYYDKLQEFTTAWKHLQRAQNYERFRLTESTVYRLAHSLQDVQLAKQLYPASFWPAKKENWIGWKEERRPVFIVGFFRSGSTLLETLLSSAHPEIYGMGETILLSYYLNQFQEEMQQLSPSPERYNHHFTQLLKKAGKRYLEDLEQKVQDWQWIHSRVNNDSHSEENISDALRDWERSFSQQPNNQSSEQDDIDLRKKKKQRFVDKLLGNYKNIPLIHLVFPRAIILHLIRDPLDTLFSCLKYRFSDASPYTLDAATLSQEYLSYLRIMDHYRRVLPVLSFERNETRQALIELRYEELVANPKKVLQRLLPLLDLPLLLEATDDVGNYNHTDAVTASNRPFTNNFTNSSRQAIKTISFLQVQQPIYNRSVGAWRKYAPQLKESLIPHLLPTLQEFAKTKRLPFQDDDDTDEVVSMNWNLSENFDYSYWLERLSFLFKPLHY